jgi:multisubunit Na+/H+ antiporter MnhB subunit
MVQPALDLVLAIVLVWLALRAQLVPELYTAVVLYIVFGLMMAMVWVRLAAPDIALAEAAVGAGLTGALLLDAARSLPREAARDRSPGHSRSMAGKAGAAASVIAIGILLMVVAFDVDLGAPRLSGQVRHAMGDAGVAHPVTAVLLNFRGFDTWLETVVLLAALLAVLALRRTHTLGDAREKTPPDGVLRLMARSVPPVLVLVAAYLLWIGTAASGGAFQAGAVLGALGVVLYLTGRRSIDALTLHPLRGAAAAGVTAFCIAALYTLTVHGRLLAFPRGPGRAGWMLTAIEAAIATAVGVTLAALFVAARPAEAAGSADQPQPRVSE